MSLDNQQVVRGNILPEGLVAPGGTSWPPDAWDQQVFYKIPENQLYIYLLSYDAWFPVISPDIASAEPVYSDFVGIAGSSFLSVRAAFFGWFRNRSVGTWNTIYRHCWWRFADPTNVVGTLSAARQFATQSDLFTFMEGHIPSAGGVYTSNVIFVAFEKINTVDPFPVRVKHRNSIVAAIRGRHSWTRMHPAGVQWGVNPSFNSGAYFLNFTNELGQRFVQAHLAVLPATNNDNVVWHHRGRKTMWRWPRVGGAVTVGPFNSRAVWDSVAAAWVTPAPVGSYVIQNPMFLEEMYNGRLLSIETSVGVDHRTHELLWPMALVFPVVNAGRYYAFSIAPHGVTSFITEDFDLGNYDLVLCVKYRHNFRKVYVGTLSPYASNAQDLLWQIPTTLCTRLNTSRPNLDVDSLPVQVDIARRDRSTGQRSRWVPLYKVTRRIHHAALRLDPAAWKW